MWGRVGVGRGAALAARAERVRRVLRCWVQVGEAEVWRVAEARGVGVCARARRVLLREERGAARRQKALSTPLARLAGRLRRPAHRLWTVGRRERAPARRRGRLRRRVAARPMQTLRRAARCRRRRWTTLWC
jgi:hypothetical protein